MKELLPLLPRPSRYLGCEWGAPRKDLSKVRGRVALAFPDLYEVGMSYLGQKILVQAINEREGLYAERVYAPSQDAAEILRSHATPLATLETDTPLAKMDAVGFSLTHELCYTNVLYMLDLAGIPLHAAERGSWDWPVIMAGGGACFNPEPIAPFLDLCVIGDGERVMPELVERVAAARRKGEPKSALLRGLAELPGVYVPSLFAWDGPGTTPRSLIPGRERVEKAMLPDLNGAPFPTAPAVPFGQAVHDRYTLELARGCTRGCRFCHAGMTYRPVRERSPEELGKTLARAIAATGFEEVSLLSLSTGDYSALETLFDTVFTRCAAEQVSIALPSLRVGSLSPKIMERIASIRRTGATIAPEAGSQRLRDVINKGITEEGILEHTRTLFAHGWQQVKLYFMIGLPTETDADLDAIVDLCLKVRDAAGRSVKRLQVSAAVSPFVPKTHTPFQWEPQISMEEIRRRVFYLKDALRSCKRVTFKSHRPEMSFLEGVLSRGDRRLAPVLESAYRKGAVFSSWRDFLDIKPYMDALGEQGLTPAEFQGPRDPDAHLPWDHLDSGVSKAYLLAERRRAYAGRVTPDCRYEGCQGCGVCNFAGHKSHLVRQSPDMDIRPRVFFSHRDQEGAAPLSGPTPEAGGEVETSNAAAPRSNLTSAAGGEVESTAGAAPLSRQTPEAGETVQAAAETPPESAAAKADGRSSRPLPPHAHPELSVRAAKYLVWYAKRAEAAYLSQLELQSILERALRRARLPLSFSAGFHPMPRLSFGRALPVGVESDCEWFALSLRELREPEAVLAALAAQMPAGLAPKHIVRLPVFQHTVEAVRERFLLRYSGPAEDVARWRGQWAELMERTTFPFLRKSKRGPKETDIRRMVAAATPRGDGSLALVFDWTDDYMSPVGLVSAVNAPISPLSLHLLKIGQEFPEE